MRENQVQGPQSRPSLSSARLNSIHCSGRTRRHAANRAPSERLGLYVVVARAVLARACCSALRFCRTCHLIALATTTCAPELRYVRCFTLEGNNSRASSEQACRSKIISMTIDLSVLEEEYEKMMHAPAVAIKPPASYSPATYPSAQRGSSMLSVCPTGLAALDCRALLNSSVEEIVCSPVALSHGFGSKSWPIASALC